jgi:hypothetical protein
VELGALVASREPGRSESGHHQRTIGPPGLIKSETIVDGQRRLTALQDFNLNP